MITISGLQQGLWLAGVGRGGGGGGEDKRLAAWTALAALQKRARSLFSKQPARPRYPLRDPTYQPIETIRPFTEVQWGVAS